MLFVSVQNLDFKDAYLSQCDGMELRLDLFDIIDKAAIDAFCKKISLPVIFTLRRMQQVPEESRLAQLFDLLTLSPAFVDIEWDTDPLFLQKVACTFPNTRIILSYHNFDETPSDLNTILEKMRSPFVYGYKIVAFARSTLDALRMLLFVRDQKVKISGICMGEHGAITRILGPLARNHINYACDAEPTAPGQLSLSELHTLYAYSTLTPSTALYGLIGNPVAHSMSHTFHNAYMRMPEHNAIYVKMPILPEELPAFFSLAQALGFSGLSVTMPLKERVCAYVKHETSSGAVNTLLFTTDGIEGYNTDGKGALDALEKKMPVKEKNIVLLGAGGAARAIAYEALQRKANVFIYNRTPERARVLANELGCSAHTQEDLKKIPYDIVINATPDACEFFPFMPNTVAMDIKNRPVLTPFLSRAQESGCTCVFGHEMFTYQAEEQRRIWNLDT